MSLHRRGIYQVIEHQSECFGLYTSVLVETSLEEAFDSKKRKGFALNRGFQPPPQG
ncbi:MAG: hypothetical protein NXI22_14720 [bacterium]|nr:hypothetical protein [bacterium]